MPNYWCKCNNCGTTFYSTNSSPTCPTCHSSNVNTQELPEETDMDDDDLDGELNPYIYY